MWPGLSLRSCALLAGVFVLGCGQQPGLVELAWQFDDLNLDRVFPQGELGNTCGLPSTTFDYDLKVRLRVVNNTDSCAEDPALEGCEIATREFDCNRFRGTIIEVPVSDPDESGDDAGYLMFAEVLVQPTNTVEPFVADPSCIQIPGPRVRTVKSGRITDLEVYQFVLSSYEIDGTPLHLDDCRPPEDTGDEAP